MSEELRNIFEGWAKAKCPYQNDDFTHVLITNGVREAYVTGCIDFVDVCLRFAEWVTVDYRFIDRYNHWLASDGSNHSTEELLIHFLTNIYQSPIK